MIFRLACPNVAFRGMFGSDMKEEAKRPAMKKLESLGFVFHADGRGFVKSADVLVRDIVTVEELVAIQVQAGVPMVMDGQTLVFESALNLAAKLVLPVDHLLCQPGQLLAERPGQLGLAVSQ